MARTANRRKAPLWVVCPHCEKPLNADIAPRTQRVSARSFIKDALLIALQDGPASPRELERRMGVKPHGCETANILRILERQGEVKLLKSQKAPSARGVPTFIWERITPTDRATRAKQPPSIDRARPNHKDSKRGARA